MLYLKKKNFTMARDDKNGKLLPPNGNEKVCKDLSAQFLHQ